MWTPDLIIINEEVLDTLVTNNVLLKSPNAIIRHTKSGIANDIKQIINSVYGQPTSILNEIQRGKKIVYLAPVYPTDVDWFMIDDIRMNCPQFPRIKFAANGCPYNCDWCYLKNTFGSKRPYITIKAEHDKLFDLVIKKVKKCQKPIMFNCGELNDSLALEHLTLFAQTFVPRFAHLHNGLLYLLTKTDDVDSIIKLSPNNHTTVGWSLNAPVISHYFEQDAPSFEKRLEAAKKAEDAGYPIRIRLDPILKYDDGTSEWKRDYSETIKIIFETLDPTRITLGTLRFGDSFFRSRNQLFSKHYIRPIADKMVPMHEPLLLSNGKTSIGKFSFPEQDRIEIFRFAIQEVRKYTDKPIALCKESDSVWAASGLDVSKIQCACILNPKLHTITTSYYDAEDSIYNPVGISQGRPKGPTRSKDYNKLAPSWDLVNRSRANKISKEDYTIEYTRDVLSKLDPQEVMNEIIALFGNDATLLCFEENAEGCHRRIVADWLEKGTGIAVNELELKKK